MHQAVRQNKLFLIQQKNITCEILTRGFGNYVSTYWPSGVMFTNQISRHTVGDPETFFL